MPDNAGAPITVTLADEAATAALAGRLARLVQPGDVLALSGVLGSGKTAFARAFVNAGSAEPEEVPSPTFTIVQAYEFADGAKSVPVHHFDLYRIDDADQARELGLEDAVADGIVLIEWPERLDGAVPGNVLAITLAQGATEDARTATLVPGGTWAARLAGAFAAESADG